MDCRTARILTLFSRPGPSELEPNDAAALQEHMHGCGECAHLAREERRLDLHLGRALRAVPIPGGLKERLLSRLDQDQRSLQRRQFWARAPWAAAAGLLLLVLAYPAYLRFASPPVVDLARLTSSPALKSPQEVEAFLQQHHWPTKLPSPLAEQWNFDRLTTVYITRLEGQPVPVLLFTKDKATARVYLLRPGQFDPDHLASFVNPSYQDAPRVLQDAPGQPIAFVVFDRESTLADFLKPLKRPTS